MVEIVALAVALHDICKLRVRNVMYLFNIRWRQKRTFISLVFNHDCVADVSENG